jgi:hypothetical protein
MLSSAESFRLGIVSGRAVMEIQRVSQLFALMFAHLGKSAHDRLLARLDRSVADARELCERADDLDADGAVTGTFQSVLAHQLWGWLRRAEAVVETVRPGGDTICGARAMELQLLIENANAAMMRVPNGPDAWAKFYQSVLDCPDRG